MGQMILKLFTLFYTIFLFLLQIISHNMWKRWFAKFIPLIVNIFISLFSLLCLLILEPFSCWFMIANEKTTNWIENVFSAVHDGFEELSFKEFNHLLHSCDKLIPRNYFLDQNIDTAGCLRTISLFSPPHVCVFSCTDFWYIEKYLFGFNLFIQHLAVIQMAWNGCMLRFCYYAFTRNSCRGGKSFLWCSALCCCVNMKVCLV